MKKTGGYIWKMIKENFLPLLGFEFVFKASAFLMFVPLIVKAIGLATDNAGLLYLTTKNISSLMHNPIMICMIVTSLLIFICISCYEICCIWSCFRGWAHGRKVSITDMFTDGFSHMRKISRRYGIRIWLLMAAVFPMFNFHMTVVLFRKVDILENCIKYIFRGIPSVYIGIISSVAVLLAASAVVRGFGRIISGKKEKNRNFFKNTFRLAVLNIITALILAVFYLALVFIAAVILRFTGRKEAAFAHLIDFESNIYYFLAFFAGMMGIVMNTAFIYAATMMPEKIPEGKPVKKAGGNNCKKILVTVLLCIVTAADAGAVIRYITNGSRLLEDIFISTKVTAHRGGARFAPENTMYGVHYAIESGADYIEIDVQLSADGEVFLLHDENLRRTTGVNKNAYNLSYEEISGLDAGSYFGNKYSDAYIPTLDEVLTECKSKINLNIELKKTGHTGNELPDKVIALIEKHEMQEQCVITSTEYAYLKYIKENYSWMRTGYIANMLYGEAASLEYADFFSVKHVVVNENFVRSAHRAGKEVHVWTVNTKYLINRMKGLDVDSIITDNPVLCKKILSRKNDRKSFAEILQTLLYK